MFGVSGVEVGSQNLSKINAENDVNMGRFFGIDFFWILMDLGSKLVGEIKKRQDKTRQDRTGQGRDMARTAQGV